MGRELKRVAMDFKWPIDKLWKGYLNPYQSISCKHCDSTGYNPETRQLADDWYDFSDTGRRWCSKITDVEVSALVEGGRLMDFTHDYVSGTGWVKKEPEYIPTAEEVNNWNEGRGFGHDGINRYICVEARGKSLGIYGECKHCKGEGEIWDSAENQDLPEKWESYDPPAGEGYQLWNTTTEGHPESPVFDNLPDLCRYLADNNVSVFGYTMLTKEQWFERLSGGPVLHTVGNITFL